ncbi:MAG: hypothetical protein GTO41_11155 [Burkholderiales bacterium]|nr:hypothetical protein [Burkholderiales bacterium]
MTAQQLFVWLESTALARTVGESLSITAWLSAIHMIGFTLVMSGALIWNLHASGALLPDAPTKSIARTAARLLALGLTVSLITGFALFAPRASYTAPNGVFQLKMALLLAAMIFQFAINLSVLRRPTTSVASLRANGVLGAMLWVSLAITACWFILFE